MSLKNFEELIDKISLIDIQLESLSKSLDQIKFSLDLNNNTIRLAGDLGRLDLVSVLLASIGVLLALFAIFGFGYIHGQCQAIADKSARRKADEVLAPYLKKIEEVLNEIRDSTGQRNGKHLEILKSQSDKEAKDF